MVLHCIGDAHVTPGDAGLPDPSVPVYDEARPFELVVSCGLHCEPRHFLHFAHPAGDEGSRNEEGRRFSATGLGRAGRSRLRGSTREGGDACRAKSSRGRAEGCRRTGGKFTGKESVGGGLQSKEGRAGSVLAGIPHPGR